MYKLYFAGFVQLESQVIVNNSVNVVHDFCGISRFSLSFITMVKGPNTYKLNLLHQHVYGILHTV